MMFDDDPVRCLAHLSAQPTADAGLRCRCHLLAPDVRAIVADFCPVRNGAGPDCIVDQLLHAANVPGDTDDLPVDLAH